MADCTSSWRIVVGHHPILSSGSHGGSASLAEHLRPLLERFGVQVYVNGHDHDLEHLSDHGIDYICSGAGSEARRVHPIPESRFACPGTGFAACTLTARTLTLRFYDQHGGMVYATEIARS